MQIKAIRYILFSRLLNLLMIYSCLVFTTSCSKLSDRYSMNKERNNTTVTFEEIVTLFVVVGI